MVTNPIDTIIRNEGGFVNRSNDKGGATKYGITQAVYSDWLGRSASVDEVRNMTEAEAREIYTIRYLSGPRIDQLPQPPQTQVLDIAVNSGPITAIKMVQRIVNMAGFGPVDVDGVCGPHTRDCVENAQNEMQNYFRNALVDERIKFYEAIVSNHPNQTEFLRGWIARANRFRLPV